MAQRIVDITRSLHSLNFHQPTDKPNSRPEGMGLQSAKRKKEENRPCRGEALALITTRSPPRERKPKQESGQHPSPGGRSHAYPCPTSRPRDTGAIPVPADLCRRDTGGWARYSKCRIGTGERAGRLCRPRLGAREHRISLPLSAAPYRSSPCLRPDMRESKGARSPRRGSESRQRGLSSLTGLILPPPPSPQTPPRAAVVAAAAAGQPSSSAARGSAGGNSTGGGGGRRCCRRSTA